MNKYCTDQAKGVSTIKFILKIKPISGDFDLSHNNIECQSVADTSLSRFIHDFRKDSIVQHPVTEANPWE